MKLSTVLATELVKATAEKRRLEAANTRIMDVLQRELGVSAVPTPVPVPAKAEIDPLRRVELLRRLESARAAKEERKKADEERQAQRLKNLQKARKALAKSRKRGKR